jgi:hypothetical protein
MDLRVMSPTSYQTALPRVGLSSIAINVRYQQAIFEIHSNSHFEVLPFGLGSSKAIT